MNTETKEVTVAEAAAPAARNYKDRLFRMIFKDPAELLSLYNAVNGTNYTDTSLLEIVTLENAIYMNVKNDLAFIIDCWLNMYEHQASFNPNMPLRFLIYVTKEYEKLLVNKPIYSTRQVKIPEPKFVVFYNGTEEQPDHTEMRLSEAYITATEDPALELRVTQVNINAGRNKELLEKCRTLREYVLYVERVRRYASEMPPADAVNRAVKECIEDDILAEFLTKNKAEAISMSIFEYNEERDRELTLQAEREYAREQGMAQGMAQGIAQGLETGIAQGLETGIAQGLETGRTQGMAAATVELLEETGTLSEELRDFIMSQTDLGILKKWHKAAARASSIEDWKQKLGL